MNKNIYYLLFLIPLLFGYVNAEMANPPSSSSNKQVGFMDFYHIPNTKNIIRFDYYTVHTVTDIKAGKRPGFHPYLPSLMNKIFLDDGSAWEIDKNAEGIYGDYIMKVGDPIIIRPNQKGSGFTFEAMSTSKNVGATLLKNETFAKSHQYEIKEIIPSDNNTFAILLLDTQAGAESLWDISESDEITRWKKGDMVILGSDISTLANTPKYLLINGSLLKQGLKTTLKADYRN